MLHLLPSTYQDDRRLRVRNVAIMFGQILHSQVAFLCSMTERQHTAATMWQRFWLGICLRDGSAMEHSTSWPPRSPYLTPTLPRLPLWDFLKDDFYAPLTIVTLKNLQGSKTNGDSKTQNSLNGRVRREVQYHLHMFRVTNLTCTEYEKTFWFTLYSGVFNFCVANISSLMNC